MTYMHLELKVCEACGMLWLRRGQIDGSYCAGCAHRFNSFPAPVGSHPGGRPRSSTRRNRGCGAAASRGDRRSQAGAR